MMVRVLVVLLAGLCAFGQSDFEALARHAVELQQGGDYAGAAEAYKQLLRMDPNQVATHVNLAVALVHLGRFDEAIAEYKQADKLLPGDPRILTNLALAYQKSGRFNDAQPVLQDLHQRDPQNEQLTFLLSECDVQVGKDLDVITLLQPMASAHASDAGFQFLLGMAYFNTGNFPAAVEWFGRAVAVKPDLPQLQSFYGQALLNTGDPQGASAAFRNALAAAPDDYDANLGLAQIAIAGRKYDEALPLAQRALEVQKDSEPANLAVAESLTGLQRYAEARPFAEAAASASPKSLDAHRTLAKIYTQLHDVQAERENTTLQSLTAAAAAAEPAPRVHDMAPDFTLLKAGSAEPVSLHSFLHKTPVVLVFGSYTCPNFRDAAADLKGLQAKYGARIPFLLVYVREAHAQGDWKNTRTQGVELPAAATIEEKQQHAMLCSRSLHLPFPALVDGMDGAVETAYSAWPARAFVIGIDGRVLYSSHLTQLDFDPAEMEAALHEAEGSKAK